MRRVGIWPVVIAFTVVASVSGTTYYLGIGPFAGARTRLVVSTTTSLYDTGLLDAIEEQFEAKHPIDIYFISAGTGIAMQYAQRGDADMILVHAPSDELTFMKGGYGVCRKIVAYNFFVIVGPAGDPANIRGSTPTRALAGIVEAGRRGHAVWVSRGDDSGTHSKEKELWTASGFNWTALRDEKWYIESGTGMGKTLLIANEKSAYTLSDTGTYLKYYKNNLISLVVIVSEGRELLNTYSAIAVDKAKNPEANFGAAITFIKFLVSEEGQQFIGDYGRDEYGQSLFRPTVQLLRENTDPTLAQWIRDYAFFDGYECPPLYQDDHKELYG